MKKKIFIIIAILLLCVIGFLTYLYLDDQKYNNIIYPGVFINSIDVSYLSYDEAKTKISESIEKALKENYILIYGDKTWYLKTRDVVNVSAEEALNKALDIGKTNNFIKNFLVRQKVKKSPLSLELAISLNEKGIMAFIEDLSQAIYTEPKNASLEIVDDKVNIINENNGIKLDEISLKAEVLEKVWSDDKTIEIPVIKIIPEITKESLAAMNIKTKVGEYSTKFNKALRERTENIKLAASILDGYILAPDDIFSFNEVVGERTGEKGFKEAPIFVNNRTVPGIGGGICQLSSTIYNVALLMDLEIIERSNHSLPVSYVPLGRDATVNYGTIDFKFKNTTKGHLLIKCKVEDDTLTVSFFGHEKPDEAIELHSEVVRKIPPPVRTINDDNLEEGKTNLIPGSPGYQVKLYKVYGGEKGEKILVSADTYNPVPSVLYVGKKKPQQEISSQADVRDDNLTTQLDH